MFMECFLALSFKLPLIMDSTETVKKLKLELAAEFLAEGK